VFAEVAQQVLEYLGVPHDIELRNPGSRPPAPVSEDNAGNASNMQALYDAANDLPSDDPLRAGSGTASAAQPARQPANQVRNQAINSTAGTNGNQPASNMPQPAAPQATKTVMVNEGKKLRVPTLIGLPVRKVIEQAAAAGLQVQITGNGTARQQAPEPGSWVPAGTQVVVRCGR
jgi:cell division protein FtsI (penicillin-binding protein 3)